MIILLTGAEGMLGKDLIPVLARYGETHCVDIHDFDVSDSKACDKYIQDIRPDLVVHTAAYTRVDECEKNRDIALKVNHLGTLNIANACHDVGARLIYYSTDYVFDGLSDHPYTEDAIPNPLSVYGYSKLMGENEIRKCLPDNSLIIRTSWLFGNGGNNFIDTILKLAKTKPELRIVNDQKGCPTYTPDLSHATGLAIEHSITGILNICNSGIVSWYGFAKYALDLVSPSTIIEPIETSDYPLPAKRPVFSALSLKKLRRLTGYDPPLWQNAVFRFLSQKDDLTLQKEHDV
ncbi:dTDP-4-dehydrorhamnose reductase [bacterium]|nr:dTDP-4-dehydrorhamnose reductase [candidate division CSSED10-310 bacterium]